MTLTIRTESRWRDKAVIPTDYRVATLVKTARQARKQLVEFDWTFTREDLERLRRAVHEWGKRVSGRFKVFDARILKAINEALDDRTSVHVLNEPPSLQHLDYHVQCVVDGELFRLTGHATFDVVFFYGASASKDDGESALRLGPTARETLASSVSMLGWDLRRLQEPEFRPVLNAIYGNAPNYGIQPTPLSTTFSGPATTLPVAFRGPFSATVCDGRRCFFTDGIAEARGIYIWTINVEGENWPWYVGQTRVGFRTRMAQHLANFLSGQYATYDPTALRRGENRLAEGAVRPRWPHTMPAFLSEHGRLTSKVAELIGCLDFHFAPLDVNSHLLNRVEGGIGRHYKQHLNSKLRDFLMPGFQVPAAIPFDEPLVLLVSSETPIAELPPTLHL